MVDRLRPLFQGGVAQNPCDAWGLGWDPEWFAKLLDQLIASSEIDPIVLVLDVPLSGHADGPMAVDMARIVAGRRRSGKTILFAAVQAQSLASIEGSKDLPRSGNSGADRGLGPR